MAFPTIPTAGANTLLTTNQSTATTTHTFPSLTTLDNAAGDLLLAIIVTYQGGSTNAEFSSWGGGFTEFIDQSANSTTVQSIGAAYKFSDGTETGTFTVTSVASNRSVMWLLSIKEAHDSTVPEATAKANGTGAAADPAALNPAGWGTEDTLWIAVAVNGETSLTGSFTGITAAPTNYGSYVDSGIIGGDVIGALEGALAFRQLNAASEDVGGFTLDTGAAGNSALLIAVRPAAGQIITLTQPSETETAQAVTRRWGVNLSQIVEDETTETDGWDNARTWNNAMAWVHPSVEPRKTVVIAQVVETETSQPVTLDTGGGQTIPIGQTTETETAQTVSTPKTVPVAQSTETESSQPTTVSKTYSGGQGIETEVAQSVTVLKTETAAQTTETETAQPVTVRKLVNTTQPVEVETAQPVTVGGGAITANQVIETESAQSVTVRRIETAAQPVETETAQPVTVRKLVQLGRGYSEPYPSEYTVPAREYEDSQSVSAAKIETLAQVVETETAQSVGFARGVSVGVAVETETARAVTLSATIYLLLGQAVESELVFAFTTFRPSFDPFEPAGGVFYDPFEPSAVPSTDPFTPTAGTHFDPFEPVS